MAVSRPLLVALLGAVLLGGVFFATRSSNDSPSSPSAKPAARQASPAPAQPARASAAKPAESSGDAVPARVERALEGRRTVVLFFYEPGAADDEATAKAVDSVRGRAAVFSAPVGKVSRYSGVTGQLAVVRAPSVVVVRRGGSARVLEGFVDPKSLAQEVADAK
jgi:hypothetical protein